MQCLMAVSESYAERLEAAFIELGSGLRAPVHGWQWGPVEAPGFFRSVMGGEAEGISEDGGVRRGVHHREEGGLTTTLWVRSSGTWVAVIRGGTRSMVACAGPRRSVREVLGWGFDAPTQTEALERLPHEVYAWQYLETEEDDLAPWEVAI